MKIAPSELHLLNPYALELLSRGERARAVTFTLAQENDAGDYVDIGNPYPSAREAALAATELGIEGAIVITRVEFHGLGWYNEAHKAAEVTQ